MARWSNTAQKDANKKRDKNDRHHHDGCDDRTPATSGGLWLASGHRIHIPDMQNAAEHTEATGNSNGELLQVIGTDNINSLRCIPLWPNSGADRPDRQPDHLARCITDAADNEQIIYEKYKFGL